MGYRTESPVSAGLGSSKWQILVQLIHEVSRCAGYEKKNRVGTYVEDPKVVYGNHTTLDLFRNLNGIGLIRPKDAGTKTVFRSIGELDGFLHGFITLDQSDRGEHCEKSQMSINRASNTG